MENTGINKSQLVIPCHVSVFPDDICDYFGVKIAMYFAYLGHYTGLLTIPSVLGIIVWFLQSESQVRYRKVGHFVSDIFCKYHPSVLICKFHNLWIV
mgnify:CR=1 FL=1